MSESKQKVPQPSAPFDQERWATYWQNMRQSWHIEPEIDEARQAELLQWLTTTPDVNKGIYPFKDKQLSRADIEWLLTMHEDGRGPVDWEDESQRERDGLDLRGADLHGIDLHGLPLARTLGAASWHDDPTITQEQRRRASISFVEADLKGTHFEGARLGWAQMQQADLRYAFLQQASLSGVRLDGAYLLYANLEGALLMGTHLDEAFLWRANLSGTSLRTAHMEGAQLTEVQFCREGDALKVGPHLADVRWGAVNLAVVNWSEMHMLGEEFDARQTTRDGKAKTDDIRLREYMEAVRANRQVAVTLQAQGLNEEASPFGYRAQVLQRTVLRLQKRTGQYIFSHFLDLLAGYGYKPGRTLIAYFLVISLFATLYAILGALFSPTITPLTAILLSFYAFHGRGFFPGSLPLTSPLVILAPLEGIMGLLIEISFIATFTQRFFAK